jgi:hypothetical protein
MFFLFVVERLGGSLALPWDRRPSVIRVFL